MQLELLPPDAPAPDSDALRHLLRVRRIYLEPAVHAHARGREVLARFPDAERIEVPSHWNIPGLHGNAGNVEAWNAVKGSTLVLGVKKGLRFEPNGRSADFLPPSAANGCVMSCAYCYVPRAKGYANPVTVFVNIEDLVRATRRHAERLGPKREPNTVDPSHWVYDIGCNSDCSADAALSDNVRDLVRLFRALPHAKASFATKLVNRDLLAYEPAGKTRVRFSLMPAHTARLLDVRASPVPERIAAIEDFVRAGYEVHLNFSPVVLTDTWREDWDALFQEVDAALSERTRAQLACEVILLTHHDRLHGVNLGWHPKAEALLWRPDLQEAKAAGPTGTTVRYRAGLKGRAVAELEALLARRMPYCRVRYAF